LNQRQIRPERRKALREENPKKGEGNSEFSPNCPFFRSRGPILPSLFAGSFIANGFSVPRGELAVPSDAADLRITALNAGDKTSSAYNEPLKTILEETRSGAQKLVPIYDSCTCRKHALDECRSWNNQRSENRIAV